MTGPTELLRRSLSDAEDLEVIMTLVEMPPGVGIPTHTHPGEEFAYVLSGTIYFQAEGEPVLSGTAGDFAAVPNGQVHSVRTGEEPARAILFRVHRQGEPERTVVQSP